MLVVLFRIFEPLFVSEAGLCNFTFSDYLSGFDRSYDVVPAFVFAPRVCILLELSVP